ncbi:30S ribosomal protein S11 [Theileria orientalis strain Shintoku]|uniref:30S ribosomal protein S11 n=1 Tax=Theileria orientalis strain Shintoku TaxID=869250 RepID=J7MES4_THEOR|nr:30S ribosomal protein S11 [Theileria orientalis strain Shintoku]BAM38699.1 30S ribosomal protein S11 [Theileria orientalis strain Shintoku]|eukprot:XP_009689000.1 30S ribosomal protein S11 [Theileria orientalis strain Shintoku]
MMFPTLRSLKHIYNINSGVYGSRYTNFPELYLKNWVNYTNRHFLITNISSNTRNASNYTYNARIDRKYATGASTNTTSAPNTPSKMLTKKELKNFQGHYQRYKRNAGLPEFHNVDLDKNGYIIEPTDKFMLVLTTSKNNVHAQLVNRSKNYKTIFGSFAGNVGYKKKLQQTEKCAYRIGENIARKCKRLGVFAVDVKFRRLMRVETVLQALQSVGLQVGQLIHEPRLPKTGINSVRPRKRRRV